jgi:excisionase family DNA binding protein
MTPRASLLTTSEVAEACNVDPETVRRWAREGRIAVITLPGGLKRFRREDVDVLLTPTEPTVGAA